MTAKAVLHSTKTDAFPTISEEPDVRAWRALLQYVNTCPEKPGLMDSLEPLAETLKQWPAKARQFPSFQPSHPCWPLAGGVIIETPQVSLLPELAGHPHIKYLELRKCELLSSLSAIETLTQIEQLAVLRCYLLSSLAGIESLTRLRTLLIDGCEQLLDLPPLAAQTQLKELDITRCGGLRHVDALATCTSLESLDFTFCLNLEDISGVRELPALKTLHLCWCEKLRILPPTPSLQSREEVTSYLQQWTQL